MNHIIIIMVLTKAKIYAKMIIENLGKVSFLIGNRRC